MNESAAKATARARLQAAGFMASLIGHPARNRLSGVRAVLELLEAGLERNLSAEHRALVLGEFNAFVDDFNLGLDSVRCATGEPAVVSARTAVDEAATLIRPVAVRRGLVLFAAGPDGPDAVRVVPALLRQVLLNLMRNAVEALEGVPGGRIDLRVERAEGRIEIEVADNGPGVPAAIHDRLFREPVTGRPGSIGLGLTLCRDAAALMDGSIAYRTPRGGAGARFRLSLPAA